MLMATAILSASMNYESFYYDGVCKICAGSLERTKYKNNDSSRINVRTMKVKSFDISNWLR